MESNRRSRGVRGLLVPRLLMISQLQQPKFDFPFTMLSDNSERRSSRSVLDML
jgi:hypothetical protein